MSHSLSKRSFLAGFAAFGLAASTGAANALSVRMVDPDTREIIEARAPLAISPMPEVPRIDRQIVPFGGSYAAGTVVIDTSERRLYLVMGGGQALRYGIGVARPGFEWRGEHRITQKQEWPDWRPPEAMLRRRPDLPRFMAGGPGNPMGARALYLGSSIYRIHGTNDASTIGEAVSSGCIRMVNEDVMDLYERVRVGTRVVVLD